MRKFGFCFVSDYLCVIITQAMSPFISYNFCQPSPPSHGRPKILNSLKGCNILCHSEAQDECKKSKVNAPGRIFQAASSGYSSSLSTIPSSSFKGLSSSRYCWYWPWFSTLALIPRGDCQLVLCPQDGDQDWKSWRTFKHANGSGVVVNSPCGF